MFGVKKLEETEVTGDERTNSATLVAKEDEEGINRIYEDGWVKIGDNAFVYLDDYEKMRNLKKQKAQKGPDFVNFNKISQGGDNGTGSQVH